MRYLFLFLFSSTVFVERGFATVKVGCQTVLSGGHHDPEEECQEPEGHLLACGTAWNPCPAVANTATVPNDDNCGHCLTLTGTAEINVVIVGKVNQADTVNQPNRPDNKYYLTSAGLTAMGQAGVPVCYDPVAQLPCTSCTQIDATEGTKAVCKHTVGCLTDMENDATATCADTTAHDNDCGTKFNPCPVAQQVPSGTVPTDGCDECFKLKKDDAEIYAHLVGKIPEKAATPDAKYFVSVEALKKLGATGSPSCYDYQSNTGTSILLTEVEETAKFEECPELVKIGCQTTMGDDTDPADQCKAQGSGGLEDCGAADKPCPLIANLASVPTSTRCGVCMTLETTQGTKIHADILGKATVEKNRPDRKYWTSPAGMKALGVSTPTCYVVATGASCGGCSTAEADEVDIACPATTTGAPTTTKSGSPRVSVLSAVVAAAGLRAVF